MSGGPAVSQKPRDEYRLPTDVKPAHYDVTIRTDLEKLTFDGYVVAHLDVLQETNKIVFNTAKLNLTSATLTSPSLSEPFVQSSSDFVTDEGNERATINLPVTLPVGAKVQVKIEFGAELTGAMMGYYHSTWEHEGKKKHYTLTQFEPTAARRVFPCWDEPLLKATFSVTMISRADTVNLSNMPAISEEPYDNTPSGSSPSELVSWLTTKFSNLTSGEDKWKVTKFEKTPPMSTYIVAFANGPFKYLEDSYKSPLSGKVRPLRIYTTEDLIHQAQFALDVKKKVLPLYEQVFDIEYPLPKLDTLVATDFDAGAMENWGLITGRTSAFLFDPEKGDLSGKKRVAVVQSHEVAHMWFGNITTMEWWDNLYLNEGFASLMGEVIILDKVFPEWNVHSSFISDALNSALNLDAKLSSHPIEVDCPDANMINQIFDALSYSKAASVLRMLSNYVGEEKFLKGVSIYLKKRLFANSVTRDLWEGIQETSGVDVPKVMDNWVKKMGYPVVKVTETKDGITVRQDRFLETGPASPEHNETLWTVPLFLVTEGADGKAVVNREIVLDEREKFIPLDTSKPFKLNAGTVGVYRVLYTSERLEAIAKESVKENSIFTLEDRIGVVYDALNLARAGYLDVSAVLSLYATFHEEKSYLVWKSIGDSLSTLASTWFEDPKIIDGLNAFRRELFIPIVERLGYEYAKDESVETLELRTMAITQAAQAGDKNVIKELQDRFKRSQEGDDSAIPPDLVRITYYTAVKHGGKKEYDAATALIPKPKNPTMGIAAMRAIGATDDLSLAEETWKYIMEKSRDQDIFYFFSGLQENPKTRHFLAEKFKANYEPVYKRLEGNFGLQHLITYSFSTLSTEKDWTETQEFFKDKDTSKFKMSLQQALDNIKTRADWVKRSSTDLKTWLENRQK